MLRNVLKSGNVGGACLEFWEDAAVAIFAVKSKAPPELDRTSYAIFFDTFSPILPKFLKKSPKPSAFIVLSESVIDFFLWQLEQKPIITSLPFEVILPLIFNVLVLCRPPTKYEPFSNLLKFIYNTNIYKYSKMYVHILYWILIICSVKVNVSPLKSTSSWSLSSKWKVVVFRTDLFIFLYWSVSGSQNNLKPIGLFKTKLKIIGCLTPYGILPSITSHFRWILFTLFKFKNFYH